MPDIYIHPSSVVEESVIGERTKIWHFCHVQGARIGSDCVIGQGCYIGPGAVVGNRAKIENNVSVFSGVVIGDDAFIGPSAAFTNDPNPRAFLPKAGRYTKTHVGRGASIGANATILCGITIGEYAAIGAGSVVTKNVPPYMLVYGNPARVIRRVDKEFSLVSEVAR